MTQEIKYIQLGDLPDHKEYKARGGWLSYGRNNALCFELLDLYNTSSKHNALITGKVNYLVGQGVKTDDLITKRILQRPNLLEDGNELLEKITTDKEIFGGYYLQLVFSKLGGQLVDVYHLPFQNVVPNENASEFFYSEKIQRGVVMSNGTVFDAYNGSNNEGTKVLYVNDYRAGSGVLTLPSYYASLKYIKIDAQIANFHYNNIISGFSAGTMIVLHNGEPTDEQKRIIAKEFKKNTTGSENAGGVFIHYANPNETEPTILPLNGDDLPKRFSQLNEQVQQEIFIGHKVVNPMLFGVKTAGQLGGRNEIVEAFDLFKQSYLEPSQKKVCTTFNLLGRINGGQGGCSIDTASPLGLDYLHLYQEGLIDKQTAQKELSIPVTTQMSSHEFEKWKDGDIGIFADFGEDEDSYEVINSIPIDFAGIQFNVDEQGARALKIIQDNPGITNAELLNLLSVTAKEGKTLIDDLVAESLLDTSKGLEVTSDGIGVIDKFKPTELIVKYKYSGSLIPTSRSFCVKLVKLRKLYTKDDIETMSRVLGYDVWKRRGGFHHNKDLNITFPHCRHEWAQVIVKKK